MKRVLKILMERDDMSREDAVELIENFVEEIEERFWAELPLSVADGDTICECEELLNVCLGLEPDFLTDIIRKS